MKWENSIDKNFKWGSEIKNKAEKEIVAAKIATYVQNGQTIGVGSGSTVFVSLTHIAEKVSDKNLDIKVIPTSFEIELACAALGLRITTLKQDKPDWYFDGADEVDPQNNLIKGRGGAMFREKLMLVSSTKNYIIIDKSKIVQKLGINFPVPVEIYPDAINYVRNQLISLGANEIELRMALKKDGPIITETGNFILDVRFREIEKTLEKELKSITGIIETGLFQGYDVTIVEP